jgi:drug/metabolite transporter (DMT)-like permease
VSTRRAVIVALGAVYLLWGSTYFAIHLMVEAAPPLLANGARYALAGAVLASFVAVREPAALRLSARQLAGVTGLGTVLLLGGNSMIVIAEQTLPSGLAAVGFALVPLWIVALRLGAGERVPRATLVAIPIGLAGVALATGSAAATAAPGLAALVLGSLCWAAGSFHARHLPLPASTAAATAWEMLVGGAVTICVGMAVGELGDASPQMLGPAALGAFAFLVLGGAVVGFLLYGWLLDHAPVSTVATHAYINPIVALSIGATAGEPLSARTLVGSAIGIGAVAFCISAEQRTTRTARW